MVYVLYVLCACPYFSYLPHPIMDSSNSTSSKKRMITFSLKNAKSIIISKCTSCVFWFKNNFNSCKDSAVIIFFELINTRCEISVLFSYDKWKQYRTKYLTKTKNSLHSFSFIRSNLFLWIKTWTRKRILFSVNMCSLLKTSIHVNISQMLNSAYIICRNLWIYSIDVVDNSNHTQGNMRNVLFECFSTKQNQYLFERTFYSLEDLT